GRGHLGHTCPNGVLRACNIFAILPASRVRTVSGSHESESALNALLLHLTQRVCKQRMPVTISPKNGELWPSPGQLILQRWDQLPSLLVNRALAAKLLIVSGDFQHSFV